MAQNYTQFADLLGRYLTRADRSQSWLAKQLGCNAAQVNRWLGGGQRPSSKEMIWTMERLLRLSHDELDELLVAADYPSRYRDNLASVSRIDLSLPDPLMNFHDELAAFDEIAAGKDRQTHLILVHGPGGTGKSRLLREYVQIADSHSLATLPIHLEQQISIEDCLTQIVYHFDVQHFLQYEAFLLTGRPEPLTLIKEQEWQRNLTRKFLTDLSNYHDAPRLVLFFDYYEKADRVFKEWMSKVFLPGIFSLHSLIVVIAGRDEIEPNPAWRGQRRFHLDGLSVEWFHHYVEACNVYLEPYLINEFHKLLHGRPKSFVEYVQAMLGSGGVR
jgi:hypothetical protein